MARRRPKIHFDIDYLSSLDADSDAPRELFYLSESGQKVLSQLAEMLLWKTRWYDQDGNRVQDVPPLAYELYEDLKVPFHLDDLIPYIDDIETLLQALQATQDYTFCCDGARELLQDHVTGIDESTDPVPQAITDSYGSATWDAAHTDYICPLLRQQWKAIDDDVLDAFAALIDLSAITLSAGIAIYVAWAGIGAASLIGGFSVGTLTAVLAALKDAASSAALGDYSDWDTHADDYVCAVINADGPDAKAAAADAFVDGLSYNALVKSVVKLMFTPTLFDNIYNGKDPNGQPIILADNSGGCPNCDVPDPVLGMNRWRINLTDINESSQNNTCSFSYVLGDPNEITVTGQPDSSCSGYRMWFYPNQNWDTPDLSGYTVTLAGWQIFVEVLDPGSGTKGQQVFGKAYTDSEFNALDGSYDIVPDLAGVPWTAADFDPWNPEGKSLVSQDAYGNVSPDGGETTWICSDTLGGTVQWKVTCYVFLWLS